MPKPVELASPNALPARPARGTGPNAGRAVAALRATAALLNAPAGPVAQRRAAPAGLMVNRLRAGDARQVLQPFWELGHDGKVTWVNGAAPEGYQRTERTRKGSPVFAHPDVMEGQRQASEREAADKQDQLRRAAEARAVPKTRRRDIPRDARRRLDAMPELLVREDHDLRSTTGQTGRRKAHLTDKGLMAPGGAPIAAAEQMNQDSVRKERGNRISSKAPVGRGEDRSQSYGGQRIGIKARKLERARLRGKPDAQHVRTLTTDEIVGELDRDRTIDREDRQKFQSYARKDREYHSVVDFHSPEDPGHFIPPRFLKYDGHDMHDSDSEAESDDDEEPAPHESTAPRIPLARPEARKAEQKKFWDEDYGMTRSSRGPESDDMDPDLYS